MKLFKLIGAAVLAMAISGCALLPDSAVTTDAKKAVMVAVTTYAKVYQPAVIAYGRLPVCPQATAVLCHDRAVFAVLAAADAKANVAITAARVVMAQNYASDPNALEKALWAIQDAQLAIAAAAIPIKKEN